MLRKLFIVFTVVAATAGHVPSPRADDPVLAFHVTVENGAVARSQRVLKVPHQAEVSITWTVDRPQVIHLEGYDVVAEVRPGKPEIMTFKAYATGRFPIHAHETGQGDAGKHARGHGALSHLEVHPK